MMNNKQTHILARLEIGFRMDAAHLWELEKDLIVTLQSARHFGRAHGSAGEWNTDWHRQWDNVEGILQRTRVLVNAMQDAIESRDGVRTEEALVAWDTIQLEDARLVVALGAIRAQASKLNADIRQDWNTLARTFELHLEAIHACAQASRVKLELLEKHSKKDVDQLVQRVLTKLPNPTLTAGVDYQEEYDRAAIELEREQHEYLGVGDLFKSFWQWFESPEERVAKNRFLRIEEAEDRRALSIAD